MARLRWQTVAAIIVATVILPAFLIFQFSNSPHGDKKGFRVGLLVPADPGPLREQTHLVLLKRDALLIDCRKVQRRNLPDSLKALLKTDAHPVLLLAADANLSVTDVVEFVDEANGIVPGIKIVLFTANIGGKSCSSLAP